MQIGQRAGIPGSLSLSHRPHPERLRQQSRSSESIRPRAMKCTKRSFALICALLAVHLSLSIGRLNAHDADRGSDTLAGAQTAKQQCINTCRARYRDCRHLNQLPSFECRGASANVSLGLTAVFRALGGGWQIRDGNNFVTPATIDQMRSRTDWGSLLPPANAPQPPAPGLPGPENIGPTDPAAGMVSARRARTCLSTRFIAQGVRFNLLKLVKVSARYPREAVVRS
jgi:hypothetical protein